MSLRSSTTQQKFILLFSLTATYACVFLLFGRLQGPLIWDEHHYWKTTLLFSDSLWLSKEEFSQYSELSTPLPFLIFGWIEYLFNRGIFAGRLFNLVLSLVMTAIIGWPSQKIRKQKEWRGFLCLIWLLLCPYYLWLSGRLYTDIISCFLGLMGVISYLKGRHVISGVMFVLAIACRQYMIAFPAAIALYEFIFLVSTRTLTVGTFSLRKEQSSYLFSDRNFRNSWTKHKKWICPLAAVLSILFWIYLFNGQATELAIQSRSTPDVQQSTWSVSYGAGLNFLSFVGCYLVIPEFLLFVNITQLRRGKRYWQQCFTTKNIVISTALLAGFLFFPPNLSAHGFVRNIFDAVLNSTVLSQLPSQLQNTIEIVALYILALAACLRFSKVSLMTLMVYLNTLVMIKSYPWDKYILPLLVVFVYLKSIGYENQPLCSAYPKEEQTELLKK